MPDDKNPDLTRARQGGQSVLGQARNLRWQTLHSGAQRPQTRDQHARHLAPTRDIKGA